MTTGKENLKGIPLAELEVKLSEQGHPSYRAHQLFKWIYQDRVEDFDQMTNLSKAFREELKEKYYLSKISVATQQESEDGTIKYLVQLGDNEKVESVYIPTVTRNTLCISTQVGCKMGCTFCATSYMGFTRNLTSGEIIDQFLSTPTPKKVTNIVLMGMGEPLDNYEEVRKALQILQDPRGPKIGKRHITLSTVGIAPKMEKFILDNLGKLAISLHGTTDEQRAKIMPVNRRYPIATLMDACRSLNLRHNRRITFEYLLIKDLNDSPEDAYRLDELLKHIPSKINLLAYNENPYIDFKRPSNERILAFQKILLDQGHTATFRISRGRDIAAACGQLRTKEKLKKAPLVTVPVQPHIVTAVSSPA